MLMQEFVYCLQQLLSRLCSQMLEPPHCLHRILRRLCSQMPSPLHCLQQLLPRLCSQMLAPRIACTRFFHDVCPVALLALASFSVVLADARPGHLTVKKASASYAAGICADARPGHLCGHFPHFFFVVSPLDLLPPTPSSFFCFWASLSSSDEGRFLISTASSLPLSWKLPCLSLASFSCFRASHLPPHLPHRAAPVLFLRPQHRNRRSTDVSCQ